jgi:threonyl-tRNA synthetase
MKEIIQRNKPFTKEVWSATRPSRCLRDKGEAYKVELVDAIPEGQDLKIYYQGDWFDLCRGPHMAATGQIGTAFKLMKVAGAYWRGDSNNPMLTRIYGTAFADQEELDSICTSSPRPRSATTASSAARWTCSISRRKGRASCSGTRKGWRMFQTLVAYMRRRLAGDLSGGERAADARQVAVGNLRPLGLVSREHVRGETACRRRRPMTSASSRSSR